MARWTGFSLKKAIKHCGRLNDGAKNIDFMGVDTYCKKGKVYNDVVSIPSRKVKAHEVLLAWELDGKPLPKIHGYPLRAVVHGYIGARYAYGGKPAQESSPALNNLREV